MAKKKKGSKKKKSTNISLLSAGGAFISGDRAIGGWGNLGNADEMRKGIIRGHRTGKDMLNTYAPVGMGIIGSKLANKILGHPGFSFGGFRFKL